MTPRERRRTRRRKKKRRSQKTNSMVSTPLNRKNLTILFCSELKKNMILLEKASKEKDFKLTASLTKTLKKLRKLFSLSDIVLVISYFLPDLFFRLQLP